MRDRATARLIGATLLLALVAGATAPVVAQGELTTEYEVVVTEDGEVESIEQRWNVSDGFYDTWVSMGDEEYDTVHERFNDNVTQNDWIGSASGEDRDVGDRYEVIQRLTDVDHTETDRFDVRQDGETIVYEATEPVDTPFDEVIQRVVVPGEITDSNAHEVDGDVATWYLHEDRPDELYVEATVDDEDDAPVGEDDLPGFGVVASLVAAVVAVGLARLRT